MYYVHSSIDLFDFIDTCSVYNIFNIYHLNIKYITNNILLIQGKR